MPLRLGLPLINDMSLEHGSIATVDRQIFDLMAQRNHLRLSAENFCSLMGQIDGSSDANDVAKVEQLLVSAMSSFDDAPIFLEIELAEN